MAKNLDSICNHLTHLNVIKDIPENLPYLDELINRAIEVRSASMLYLAVQLKHDQNSLGLAGLPLH